MIRFVDDPAREELKEYLRLADPLSCDTDTEDFEAVYGAMADAAVEWMLRRLSV